MSQKSITNFLAEEYKEFAMYTIEGRAIPSVIDGFKPTARKIIHASANIWRTGQEKPLKVFQLSGKVASDCLHYDTEVSLANGETIKIGDWYHKFPDLSLEVLSIDENGETIIGIGHNPKMSLQKFVYEIETEDGVIHKLSENHLVMLSDGTYKKVSELSEEDDIRKKIINITKIVLDKPEYYYDISVDKYHNFVINDSIVVHNCFYHHGSSSLENAIITMAQKFKNNAPLLEEIGQFGSLRSPQAAAPRYIGTKLSNNFRLLYKDFELLEFKEEEGESIEPRYFLPIIPTVLINGSQGISVGFTSNVLNRDIKGIVDACIDILKGKEPRDVKPSLNEFTGEFTRDPENHRRWLIRGKFQRVNTSTIRITELPPSLTYEKYEEILDDLCDKKKIVSYDDNCADNVDFTVKFTRSELEKIDDEKLVKLLKLEEAETEAFSTLDENGKLRIFDNVADIIKYFVKFRLNYYHKRKEFLLDRMNKDLKLLSNRGRFIKAILDEKIKINNVPKLEIINSIELMGLDQIDGSYDYLLRMPIYSLTQELFEKLKADFTAKKAEIKKLEETDPGDMYLDDLDELKKKFK